MNGLQILLLEDNLLDAELIKSILTEGGIDCELMRVSTRSDFEAAITTHSFELILADYALPSFDGLSALEKAQTICPDVPFIFISGVLGEELAIEMLKSGALDYVLKQRLGRLIPSVRRALREREERKARQQAETERAQLLAREQAARAAAETANRVKDEFLAVLSHELRSPLNAILGWSKLLKDRKFDAATTARAIDIIERNARLQAELIEDLLDISRILQGKLSLQVSPVDLRQPIEAAIDTMRLAAQAKSIQIQAELNPSGAIVNGDPNRLQQIVWNLLANAIKFTPQGGRVLIRLEVSDLMAQIQVSDTGKGIAPDFLPYIFEYFRQADSSLTRTQGGLGLGLAIARHLVELHGGNILADSLGDGLGATFTVQLPLCDRRLEGFDNSEQCDNPLSLEGVRILLIDDQPDSLEFLAFTLDQSGAEVMAIASADNVLVEIRQFQPDVLVSDIGMPETDGYTLIHQIRTLAPEQGGRIPALALSAYASDADRQQALQAGFQQHIAKPVEPDTLVRAIANLARRHKSMEK
ncbi:MAG: response regulator [Chroococcidiopsidaceae cyanobacterium CP_BM_ER_R8_30]|nr:response regulator [Chroococcidiopsidaceae cyanobacterium CP_BM_ER_R8_30]